jgi:hypothetical protein
MQILKAVDVPFGLLGALPMMKKGMLTIAGSDGAWYFKGYCDLRSVSTSLRMRRDMLHSAQVSQNCHSLGCDIAGMSKRMEERERRRLKRKVIAGRQRHGCMLDGCKGTEEMRSSI